MSRGERGSRGGFILYLTAGTLASIVFLLPLAWAVLRSLMPSNLVTQAPSGADFSHLTTANYTGLISANGILHYALNSLLVACGTGLLTAIVATMAGYGFARFRFRGSGIVFALVLVTLMVPFQALLTPLFLELHSLGLLNSLVGLALFYTTFNLPFGVFVMRNTFLQIPWELSEAAAVDGASTARTLISVLRPLVVPGIATTVLFAFLFSWTEFVGALTFITSNNLYTLPLALLNMEYGSVGQVNFGYLEAGAVIAMIPCVLLYIGLQRFYIRGLMSGVVKGLRGRGRSGAGGLEFGLQDAAQQLSGLGLRELGAEDDGLRGLGGPQALFHPLPDLFGVPLPDDHRDHALAPLGVGDADHGRLADAGVGEQHVLDLRRSDVLPAPDDRVVGAALDEQVAVRIEPAPVPGGEPAAGVQRARPAVLAGDLIAADEHQAGLPGPERRAVVPADLELDPGQCPAHGPEPVAHRLVVRRQRRPVVLR